MKFGAEILRSLWILIQIAKSDHAEPNKGPKHQIITQDLRSYGIMHSIEW